MLFVRGAVAAEMREFSVGVGKSAQAKNAFRAGDEVSGEAVAVANPEMEPRAGIAGHSASEVCLPVTRFTGSEPAGISSLRPTAAPQRKGRRRHDAFGRGLSRPSRKGPISFPLVEGSGGSA